MRYLVVVGDRIRYDGTNDLAAITALNGALKAGEDADMLGVMPAQRMTGERAVPAELAAYLLLNQAVHRGRASAQVVEARDALRRHFARG